MISGGASNGGITLKLERGENHLNGDQALALARTRENQSNEDQSYDDTDRARTQQLILEGIKHQLTSPWRAPINFIKGPWIAWNAPKAMVSDMGGFVLPAGRDLGRDRRRLRDEDPDPVRARPPTAT